LDLRRLSEAITPPKTALGTAELTRDAAEIRQRDEEARQFLERHAERRGRYEEAL